MVNLVNLENVSKSYGSRAVLGNVSLGVAAGERIGVVGRNGDGKTTLVSVLAKAARADSGRVTHARGLSVGYLPQADGGDGTVREMVLGSRRDHEWAGDPHAREVMAVLLGAVELDVPAGRLSGGERRRAALARLLIAAPGLLVLDEPTNHLDLEAIAWLAGHLRERGTAVVLVTHDRWLLDAICEQMWEVASGQVHKYEGGYSAYVLAKAERARLAAAAERRRRNLLRKELAWLRRGAPARTSKPKFRLEAAAELIAGEPPPRDGAELARLATARLGRTVLGLREVTVRLGDRTVFDRVSWQLGPGDRVGVVGANGSGKTTLLALLEGTLGPDAHVTGQLTRGKTVRIGHLTQELAELDPSLRVIEAAEEVRVQARVGKRELSARQLLERLGFAGGRMQNLVSALSGGERRRLALLRLLMGEPNVLLLDEPTNDLDVENLTEVEDLLDDWPGSLLAVSHDRYFLERVTDHVLALTGDGKLSFLGGGVAEYIRYAGYAEYAGYAGPAENKDMAHARPAPPVASRRSSLEPAVSPGAAARARAARKELQRVERRLDRLGTEEAELTSSMSEQASDYRKLLELGDRLRGVQQERANLEERWLSLAEQAQDGDSDSRSGP